MSENCVYVREVCPKCDGSGKAKIYDEWGCLICRNCDGDGYIVFWQPVIEFMASLGQLVEVEVSNGTLP